MIPVRYALDALNFLSADVRNLFGPFINVFLVTGRHWSQTMSDSRRPEPACLESRFRLRSELRLT
jgi:hypothetical protein